MPIMFEGKYKRARKLQQERMGTENDDLRGEVPMQTQMEKGDLPAMIIAAFLTILPVALIVLAVLALAGVFFVRR